MRSGKFHAMGKRGECFSDATYLNWHFDMFKCNLPCQNISFFSRTQSNAIRPQCGRLPYPLRWDLSWSNKPLSFQIVVPQFKFYKENNNKKHAIAASVKIYNLPGPSLKIIWKFSVTLRFFKIIVRFYNWMEIICYFKFIKLINNHLLNSV